VIRLRLPALRERREDIPLLAKYFLQQSAVNLGVDAKVLSPDALKYLSTVNWSGNVRQLENVCHWLTVMAPGQNIDVADLPPELKESGAKTISNNSWQEALAQEVTDALNRGEQGILDSITKDFERVMIKKALQHTDGRRIEAATQLGMGRNTLTRKIQELGIED
jgi:two-component system nitrogen regulation response regulator GlnG